MAKKSKKQETIENYEALTSQLDPREKTIDEEKRDALHDLLQNKPGFGTLVDQFREMIQSDPKTLRALRDICPESDADEAFDFGGMLRAMGAYTHTDVQNDGYVFTWPGKQKAIQLGNEPTTQTLIPDKADSKDWDTTQNIYIEADNLEALKCLRNTYAGKIKMIYIDPPYNTGNDFIYNDTFHGEKVSSDDAGKHTKWLNMMYPRLMLARELLSPDGVIFISIDDNEAANLREICDKIFGDNNFITNLIWEKKYTRSNDATWFSDNHDFILVYCKNSVNVNIGRLPRSEDMNLAYKNPDNHPKGVWKSTPLHAKSGSNPNFSFRFKNGILFTPPAGTYSRYSAESLKQMDENNEIWFGVDGKATPSRKTFLCDLKKEGVTPVTIISHEEGGHNHESVEELKNIFNDNIFQNPKPTKLIRLLSKLAIFSSNDIALDFFSGSATTAHAVMQLNAEDGGHRKYIMVQLPELTKSDGEAYKAGYKNIAEIGKERIRRAGEKIKADNPLTTKDLDIGFRVFRVGESNIPKWWKAGKDAVQLELFEEHKKHETEEEKNNRYRAICYEVMLKYKCLLSAHVDEYLTTEAMEQTGGKPLFVVDGGLFICPEGRVDEAWAKAIVKLYESKYKLPISLDDKDKDKDNSWTVVINDGMDAGNDETRDSDMAMAARTLVEAGLPKGKFMYI